MQKYYKYFKISNIIKKIICLKNLCKFYNVQEL